MDAAFAGPMAAPFPYFDLVKVIALLLALFGAAAFSSGCEDTTCESGGKTYSPGDNWACDCNTCACNDDGSISSTDIGCSTAGAPNK